MTLLSLVPIVNVFYEWSQSLYSVRDRVVVHRQDVGSYSVVQFKKGGDREGILKAIRTKSFLEIDYKTGIRY